MEDPFILTMDKPGTLPLPFGGPRLITGTATGMMLVLLPNDGSLPVLPFLDELTCVTYIDLMTSQRGSAFSRGDSRARRSL